MKKNAKKFKVFLTVCIILILLLPVDRVVVKQIQSGQYSIAIQSILSLIALLAYLITSYFAGKCILKRISKHKSKNGGSYKEEYSTAVNTIPALDNPNDFYRKSKYAADIYEIIDALQLIGLNCRGNSQSTTPDGRYDFHSFSVEEITIIVNALNAADLVRNEKYRGISLFMQTYETIYKPRYILNELVIIRYETSDIPLDQLAVGFAYAGKGAFFRQQAIYYIENAIAVISDKDLSFISQKIPLWTIYNKLSDLYEAEYEFQTALKYAQLTIEHKDQLALYDILHPGRIFKKINIDACVAYYDALQYNEDAQNYKEQVKKELQEAQRLAEEHYVFKPRKSKQTEAAKELEQQIHSASIQILCEYEKHSNIRIKKNVFAMKMFQNIQKHFLYVFQCSNSVTLL